MKYRFNNEYTEDHHSTLFENLEREGRDHFHVRHGVKTKIHYLNICALDFKNKTFWGHLVGPDDDKTGRRNLIDIIYKVTVGKSGKPIIHIEYTDGKTSPEQSLRLVEHALVKMAKKSNDLESNHPFNGNLHGLYLYSAKNKGFHKDFEKVVNDAERNLIIPNSFKKSLVSIGYDLQFRTSGA